MFRFETIQQHVASITNKLSPFLFNIIINNILFIKGKIIYHSADNHLHADVTE